MKKALLAAVCFIIVSFILVGGVPSLPDLLEWLNDIDLNINLGLPQAGSAGKPVHVALVSDHSPQQLYPGGTASRMTAVRNDGEGDVCFRLAYAIQYDAETWPMLEFVFTAAPDFEESDWLPVTIDNTPYRMKVFTYTRALAPGATSPGVMLTITMDRRITTEQLNRYRSDFLQSQVMGVDPTPFLKDELVNPVDILDVALPLDTLKPF